MELPCLSLASSCRACRRSCSSRNRSFQGLVLNHSYVLTDESGCFRRFSQHKRLLQASTTSHCAECSRPSALPYSRRPRRRPRPVRSHGAPPVRPPEYISSASKYWSCWGGLSARLASGINPCILQHCASFESAMPCVSLEANSLPQPGQAGLRSVQFG